MHLYSVHVFSILSYDKYAFCTVYTIDCTTFTQSQCAMYYHRPR